MIAFELAAAIVALTAAPQQMDPSRSSSTHRAGERANTRTATTTAQPLKSERPMPRAKTSTSLCSRSNTAYNAKTHTYRDARGKRQRCAR